MYKYQNNNFILLQVKCECLAYRVMFAISSQEFIFNQSVDKDKKESIIDRSENLHRNSVNSN